MADVNDEKQTITSTPDEGVRIVKKPAGKVATPATSPEINQETDEKKGLVKPMESKSTKNDKLRMTLMSLVVVTLGLLSGYGLSRAMGGRVETKSFGEVADAELAVGDVIGSENEKIFSDEVEGVIVKGGIEGEGSHHLLRPGGDSQTVYMTSSVLDLDKFVDHRVKVWGETFDAQKAGWLMDAGRIEVLELNAEKPFEE
jgi:hypothetical protein